MLYQLEINRIYKFGFPNDEKYKSKNLILLQTKSESMSKYRFKFKKKEKRLFTHILSL